MAFAAVLAVLCAGPSSARGEEAPETPQRVRALLVGVSEYPLLAARGSALRCRLDGPPNDVVLWREVLLRHLGARRSDVYELVGWPEDPAARPTRANILGTLQSWIEGDSALRPGERVFLVFSGHGSRIPDRDGDEADAWDEVFLPADTAPWKDGRLPGAIADDEWGGLVARLRERGAEVVCVWDCCHAGSMLRAGSGPRVRRLGHEDLGIPPSAPSPSPAARRAGPRASTRKGVVVVYASRSHQVAVELALPLDDPAARPCGVLTFCLTRAIARAHGRASFRDLYAAVLPAYADLYGGSYPLFEEDLDLPVGAPHVPGDFRAVVAGDRFRLDGGRLAGLEVGAILEVRALGSTEGSASLGRLVVEEASLVEAFARALGEGGRLELPEGQRVGLARLVALPPPEWRVPIAVVDETGDALPLTSLHLAIRAVWADPRLARLCPLVERTEDAQWQLVRGKGSEHRLRRARTGAPPASGVPVEPSTLKAHLLRIFRHQNLSRIARAVRPPTGGPRLEVEIQPYGADDPLPLKPGQSVQPGSELHLAITNETSEDWDVWAFVLESDHGVEEVWPRSRSSLVGAQDVREQKTPIWLTASLPGVEQLLFFAVPHDPERPIDLSFLADGAKRKGRERGAERVHAFEALMEELAYGDRTGAATRERSPLRVGSATDGGARDGIVRAVSWQMEPWTIEPRLPEAARRLTAGAHPRADRVARSRLAPYPTSVPDPCLPTGPNVWGLSTTGADDARPFDVLYTGGETPDRMLVDLDDEAGLDAGGGEAELILRFEDGRRIAYYDTRNEGRHDLVLVDHDADPEADLRYTWGSDGAWSVTPVHVPWLSTEAFSFLDDARRVHVLKIFAALQAHARAGAGAR